MTLRELGVAHSGSSSQAERFAYTAGGLVEYHGWAPAGSLEGQAIWAICKFTYTGSNLVTIIWADGNTNNDNVWTNYGTLTYV